MCGHNGGQAGVHKLETRQAKRRRARQADRQADINPQHGYYLEAETSNDIIKNVALPEHKAAII